MSLARDDSTLFGFDSEAWIEHVRAAESAALPGRLGAYQLLGEAGRGGQGIVFRARQPGTGRDVALKRLLAGAFATPAARRRFEREVEAVTALGHPGIVTVYGVEEVDGVPVLAMEWIEGEPVTAWAAGRARGDVLRCFLDVCAAVQHAHQRGVLHRDLKPSNVVVDPTGRVRVLDFGLAKLAADEARDVSRTGDFVGTPAYAAPEQLRGEVVDARADVHALGALLFEMLTGRRLHEGEGSELLARATSEPRRPSALVPSIPRELDAIVLAALATEREQRYQSVDALASDVRRLLAGEAVLAHSPGALYQLRKLVARNRTSSVLVALLALATLVYAALATRQARRLAEERDRAVAAGDAADAERRRAEAARVRASEEERRADAARDVAETARAQAEAETAKAEAALEFLVEDVIAAADPVVLGHEPTLVEILRAAAPKVDERFGSSPDVEATVRTMLGDAFLGLGHYAEAEAELRRVLALREKDATASPVELARAEHGLGRVLVWTGAHAEARARLEAAIAALEVGDEPALLGTALHDLGALHLRAGDLDAAVPLLERALESCVGDEGDSLAVRNDLGAAMYGAGRFAEARPVFQAALDEMGAAGLGETDGAASLLANLAATHQALGDAAAAEEAYRRALEIESGIFGDEHPATAATMGRLAQLLMTRGELDEAEELALQSLEVVRAAAPEGNDAADHAHWLGMIRLQRGDDAGAEAPLREALAAYARLFPPEHPGRSSCTVNLGLALTGLGKLDEAEELLAGEAEMRRRRFGDASPQLAAALQNLAGVVQRRGELEDAVALYEEVEAILAPLDGYGGRRAAALASLATALRKLGESERAAEVERRAAELEGD